MTCPICKRPVKKTEAEFPFCSDRCRTVDLGNWASEKYVISTSIDPRELPDLLEADRSDQHEES